MGGQDGEFGVLVNRLPGITMGKTNVPNVTGIVYTIEVVTGPVFRWIDFEDSGAIEAGITPERRRFFVAKVHEDESKILLGRIATNVNLFRIGLILTRLLDALS